jgi:hypothetical protein
VSRAFFLVFLQMAAGGLPLLWAVRPREFGPGFFRTMAIVYFCVGLGGAYGAGKPADLVSLGGASWILMVAFLALTAVYALLLWRDEPNPHPPIFFAACYAGLGHLLLESFVTPVSGMRFLMPISFLSSALVLGLTLTGMWLGHYYLTSSSIPLGPLRRFGRTYLVAMGLHTALIAVITLVHLTDPTSPVRSSLAVNNFQDVLSWVRLLVGIAVPMGLAWMIDQTAKIGSNMSFTGLFYLALGHMLAGELIGRVYLVTRNALF